MPIKVFRNSSNIFEKKIDTSLFVQKPYLGPNYIKSNIGEHIDLENKYRIKNLPDPISIREDCIKHYADDLFNQPSILKDTAHADFNDKNLNIVRFIKVYSIPTLEEYLTPKLYVEQLSILFLIL